MPVVVDVISGIIGLAIDVLGPAAASECKTFTSCHGSHT